MPERTSTPPHNGEPTHDEIAALAFQFHQTAGGRHGRDQEDWFRAEALLRHRSLVPSSLAPALGVNPQEGLPADPDEIGEDDRAPHAEVSIKPGPAGGTAASGKGRGRSRSG